MPEKETAGSGPARLDAPLLTLVGVMVLGGMMSYLDATIVNVGISTLGGEFHATLATVEWVTTGYLLAVALAIPAAGWAVVRFGAKRMWLLGLSVFLIGSALCACAWNAESLIAFRIVQGLGGGMIDPIMMAVVAGAAGPARIGRVMGLVSVPLTLGPVVGPVIGGLLLDSFSWQWMFLVNIPFALAAIVLAVRVLPADPAPGGVPAPLDALGVALLCPGFAALVFALSQAGRAGFGEAEVIVGLAVGLTLFVAYAVHALRTTGTPLLDLRLFTSKGFSASVTTMFLLGGGLFSLLFLLPLYYQQVRGHTVLESGLLLAPLGLGTLIGMPVAGSLADRAGARRLVPAGALLIGAGALVFTGSDAGTSQITLTAAQFAAGFGMGLVGAPTMGSVYRTVPGDAVAGATGAVFILNQIGASLGIAVVALILQSGGSGTTPGAGTFADAFWWPVAGAVVVFVAGLLLPGRPRPEPASGEPAAGTRPVPDHA
ncbi:DHA2 family efflux MFS transporter permease subunit [Streptomyces sp. RKAG290]|uniref:DHA2 family efflux MFS transporter permease subunit n=1 Tax=Streptomyces sp. RKAG290 TaxID=2888348 RepID=UPI0020343361|nr:DHA2 family efflux MFS transporter permease subunit [Streptomyces sp. RKAG290]MCM2415634.1 DHA2 family efflux MFS transporter permease subunit [Streptomyces sp. RKAG290]